MSYIPPLPGDMVDEYLTFNCKSLDKIERKINAASADGYKMVGRIKQYLRPENDQYHARERWWAVMTKRVDPKLLAAAVKGETQSETIGEAFIAHQVDEPAPVPERMGLNKFIETHKPDGPKRNTRPPFR